MATRTMDTEVDVQNRDGSVVSGMYAEKFIFILAAPRVQTY